ncbi:hypothetical protein EYF80_023164 [Liparis tanakae]|uniref:Uncharacterized protein n=1 Tax=Liparis tanakae TaxID=230148 RepID=A0A4Z2HM31_9TELE|nr:hypothetical protein EYF80_023164 [Liparis tanakae]
MPRYCRSFIDESACLVPRSSRAVLHADERGGIQQGNEKAGVGVTEGRMRHCVFTRRGGYKGKRSKRSEHSAESGFDKDGESKHSLDNDGCVRKGVTRDGDRPPLAHGKISLE